MTTSGHRGDSDSRRAPARAPQSLSTPAAAPRRAARTVSGDEVGPAELHVAAQAARLPARLGLRGRVDGFLAWRAYAVLRAAWRLAARRR